MTWLYLPSNCAPESECSAKVCEPHSTFSASDTAPFATWNGKPLLPPSLPRLWKQERSIRRLSGLISSPSEAATGAARWIASLPDSRARTSASPVGARGSMASAPGCSSTSSTSPTLAVRGASLWRTSAPSLLPPPPLWTKKKASSTKGQPPASWENWPTAGGTRSGSLFPRPMWEPATGGPGGSASRGGETWPTPDAALHAGANRSQSDGAAVRPNISLKAQQWLTPHGMGTTDHSGKLGAGGEFAQQATQWQTPSVSSPNKEYTRDSGVKGQERLALAGQTKQWATPSLPQGGGKTRGGARSHELLLPGQAEQWPTPNAHDGRRPGADLTSTQGGNLSRDAVVWPTPAARDYKGANSAEHALQTGGGRKHMDQLANFVAHSPSSPQAQPTSDGPESSPVAPTSPQRLNPAFGCWLMGWPFWWTNPGITNCVRSEMVSYRFALRSHLSSLLGEREC